MDSNKLKSIKVEHLAIIFLVIGLIILYFMSLASQPTFIDDYSELDNYEGETVIVKGIVLDYDSTVYGGTYLTVLEPDDLESTLKIFIETYGGNLTVGDIVQAKGTVLRLNENLLELVVVNEKDITIIGHWHHHRLSLPELAHRLEYHPDEFKYLPVEIKGYLKFEPRLPITSISLTEHPTDGFYSVKVEIHDPTKLISELHKGDLVSLNVSIEYDENNFEYRLISKNLTILEPYGSWEVSFSELMAAPFVFEGAEINITGYVHEYKSYYNYIVLFESPSGLRSLTNSSIWVDISALNLTDTCIWDDYLISISGKLYYDPQYIDYAIKANELSLG